MIHGVCHDLDILHGRWNKVGFLASVGKHRSSTKVYVFNVGSDVIKAKCQLLLFLAGVPFRFSTFLFLTLSLGDGLELLITDSCLFHALDVGLLFSPNPILFGLLISKTLFFKARDVGLLFSLNPTLFGLLISKTLFFDQSGLLSFLGGGLGECKYSKDMQQY